MISQARQRLIGLYGMSRYRADRATHPPELVLSFGNLNINTIERGIAARRRPAPRQIAPERAVLPHRMREATSPADESRILGQAFFALATPTAGWAMQQIVAARSSLSGPTAVLCGRESGREGSARR